MQCQLEGHYRAKIIDYGLKEMKDSGAVAVTIRCALLARFEQISGDETGWVEATEPTTCDGDVWIISNADKRNAPIEVNIQALINHAGWDGELASVVEQTWKPWPCQVTVKGEAYKGRVYYKASFINSWNAEPHSGLNKVTATKLRELELRYGDTLRGYRPDEPVKPPVVAPDPNDWQPPAPRDYLDYPPGGEDIPF